MAILRFGFLGGIKDEPSQALFIDENTAQNVAHDTFPSKMW